MTVSPSSPNPVHVWPTCGCAPLGATFTRREVQEFYALHSTRDLEQALPRWAVHEHLRAMSVSPADSIADAFELGRLRHLQRRYDETHRESLGDDGRAGLRLALTDPGLLETVLAAVHDTADEAAWDPDVVRRVTAALAALSDAVAPA